MMIEGLSEADSEQLVHELGIVVIMNPGGMCLTKLGETIAAKPKLKSLVTRYASEQGDAFIEGSHLGQFVRASVDADLCQQWPDLVDAYAAEFDVRRDDVSYVLQVMLRDEMARRIRRDLKLWQEK